jgi:thioredoxin reductase (NADPH)
MLDRVKSNKKIRIITNRVVTKWVGSQKSLSGVQVSDPKNPAVTETIPCEAGFIAIGHKPNTKFLKNQVRNNEELTFSPFDGISC